MKANIQTGTCPEKIPLQDISIRQDWNYNKKDITGKRYGRLTALYPTEKRDYKGSVIWHCRCDCGNEIDVSHDSLNYGHYSSCGCRKKELQAAVSDNLTFVDNTCLEWLEKRKYRQDNTSGFRGVVQRKNGNYSVNIGFQQKRYYLGTYDTYSDAVKVRLEAEEMIHGGFVRACRKRDQKGSDLVFEIKKGDGFLEIESNDTEENGRRIEF